MCVYASIADLYETFRTNQSLSASLNCKNWMQSEDNSERTEFCVSHWVVVCGLREQVLIP